MKNLSQNQKVKILKIPALPVFKEKNRFESDTRRE
jgi:hypothetical protein